MNMSQTYSLSPILIIGIFVAGFGLGWVLASVRFRASGGSNFEKLAGELANRSANLSGVSSRRIYEVRCKCGAALKFRGAHDAGPSELPPFPDGDSYTCPSCGASVDLKKIRGLIQNAKLPQ